MKLVAIIPYFNHPRTVQKVCTELRGKGLEVIVVDDGSNDEGLQALEPLKDTPGVAVVYRDQNGGKGAAVMTGLIYALENGYTHGVQVDADGQHDLSSIEPLIAQAQANPQAVICGRPEYDESVPKHRYYARYLTHVWVWIECLSTTIKDSMCGFRIYPLKATVDLVANRNMFKRMAFDVEVLVRLYWRGLEIIDVPVSVNYPEDGVSHFLPWRDNVEISLNHTLLVLGMIPRAPKLMLRWFR